MNRGTGDAKFRGRPGAKATARIASAMPVAEMQEILTIRGGDMT